MPGELACQAFKVGWGSAEFDEVRDAGGGIESDPVNEFSQVHEAGMGRDRIQVAAQGGFRARVPGEGYCLRKVC